MNLRSLAFAVTTLVLAAFPSLAQAAPEAGPQIGQPAPAFLLKTTDGRLVSPATYRGRTLVLNTWATWCPPCRGETPDLIRAYRALAGPGVAFLGIDSTEHAPIVRAFVAAKGVPYPQAIDAQNTFSRAYDIRYFPTTFVIGPDGVLRARYVDVISPRTLRAFVSAAAEGRNAVITSPLAQKIDARLDPSAFPFGGTPQQARAGVKAANSAIAAAEDLLDQSDPAKGQIVDLVRVHGQESALRERAIVALRSIAQNDRDRELLARMQGDDATERERWHDAITDYDRALAIDARDVDALSGLAFAAGRAKDAARVVAADRTLAQLAPSPDAFIELGNAEQNLHDVRGAAHAFAQAQRLARIAVSAHSGDARAIRKLAGVYLFTGRFYATTGDVPRARAAFADLTAWTLRLPRTDNRYAMYLEEAQEATVALDLDPGIARKTAISLAPWTGADLPGSVASTIKYRLVVAGAPGKTVRLTASGLPKYWVASFCTDRVCAPFHVETAIPTSGVRVIEFQVIPDSPGARVRPAVRIDATDGAVRSSATAIVALR